MADLTSDSPGRPARSSGVSNVQVFGYGAGNFGFVLLGLVVAVNLQFFYADFVGLSAGSALSSMAGRR